MENERKVEMGSEADVRFGQNGGENPWPRFGKPLIGPLGGGEPVKESDLTWLDDLDRLKR